MNDYSELRAKAKSATPGPWEKLGREARIDFWISSYHPDLGSKPVALIPPLCEAFSANADYIAAVSPDVLLALLDEVERLRAALVTVKQWGDGLKDPEQTYVAEVLLIDALAAVDAALNSSTEVTG